MIDRHLTPGKESRLLTDVPASHQEAAERIRTHLVCLRGGAPFLSPMDASALVAWLDAGVPEARILRGLEEAAKKRRAQRKRSRLELRHAKKWLGRPRGRPDLCAPVAAEQSDHALGPLINALCGPQPDRSPSLEERRSLAAQLGALEGDSDHIAAQAIRLVGAWFDQTWKALDDDTRGSFIGEARDELDDILDMLADFEEDELIEEHARGLHRDTCPTLSATTILQLLG